MHLVNTALGTLGRFWARRKIRKRYRNEILLLHGDHRPSSNLSSILHFTVERAASRFVGTVMHDLARGAGLTPIDLDGYFFEVAAIDEWLEARGGPRSILFHERGYLYGPLRTSTDHLLDREPFRILISLRDPRDVLVSLYHNYAYEGARPRLARAHRLSERERRAARLRERSVDDFVLESFDDWAHVLTSYEAYCGRLGRSNILFVKYEDMVRNFDAWLDRVVSFFELEPTQAVLGQILRRADFGVPVGRPSGPKRQVAPGEHRRKLQPRTIESLTSTFRHVLDRLDYPVDPEY